MNDAPVTTNSRSTPTPVMEVGHDVGMSLRAILPRLVKGEGLPKHHAAKLLDALLDADATDAQIGAALIALTIKGPSVEELVGLAGAMRERAVRIQCQQDRFIDTAGTGSSSAKCFNVSTATAFVVAGAGLPVAKHGARAATSHTGSADVLSELGVEINASREVSEQCLNEVGLCFMFAPLYHQATARVAAIRRQLGVRTAFNLVGPLTNPAGAPNQIIGVWHSTLIETMAHALSRLGTTKSWVVHGRDGLDEITVTGKTAVAESSAGKLRTFEIEPKDFGLSVSSLESIRCDDPKSSAAIVRNVLNGTRRDAARDLVIINAAAALFVGGLARDLNHARLQAETSIDEGAALAKLQQLIARTNR